MAVKLGRRQVPSSSDLLRAEAKRFLTKQGTVGAAVFRVEAEAPGITWFLFVTTTGKARHMVVAGATGSWVKVSEGSGWPVA